MAAVWQLDCRELKKQARRPVRRLLELLLGKRKVTWMRGTITRDNFGIILENPQNFEGGRNGRYQFGFLVVPSN